jgi:hypothetical protein
VFGSTPTFSTSVAEIPRIARSPLRIGPSIIAASRGTIIFEINNQP